MRKLSEILDAVSDFLSTRKGLLPLIGILLVIVNFLLQFLSAGWLSSSDFFLHLGVIIAILGFMLAWAL